MISPAVQRMVPELADPPEVEGGIRMMSPDGDICVIPRDQVEAAIADGGKVMNDQDMAQMFNRQEIERRFFEKKFAQKHKPIRRSAGRGRR